MLVLLMAATLRDQLPSVVFEQSNEFAELHTAHRAETLGRAMSPDESGERETWTP